MHNWSNGSTNIRNYVRIINSYFGYLISKCGYFLERNIISG